MPLRMWLRFRHSVKHYSYVHRLPVLSRSLDSYAQSASDHSRRKALSTVYLTPHAEKKHKINHFMNLMPVIRDTTTIRSFVALSEANVRALRPKWVADQALSHHLHLLVLTERVE